MTEMKNICGKIPKDLHEKVEAEWQNKDSMEGAEPATGESEKEETQPDEETEPEGENEPDEEAELKEESEPDEETQPEEETKAEEPTEW